MIVSEEYINLFSELRADCLTLDLSRDELNKLERQEDRGYRRFILNVLLTILGILVAAFGVAATIYFTIKS